MRVLLDVDIRIHIINRNPGYERTIGRVSGRSYGEISLSAVTLSELRFGVARSAWAQDFGLVQIEAALSTAQSSSSSSTLGQIVPIQPCTLHQRLPRRQFGVTLALLGTVG